MKKRKPEDERFFKDIVLNNILEEISNEHGKTLQRTSSKPKKITKNWIVSLSSIVVLATFLAVFLSLPGIDETTEAAEEPVKQIKETSTTISKKSVQTSQKPTQITERERAKAALLQQMKD